MIECMLAFLVACIVGPILLSMARRGSDPGSGQNGQGNEGGWR